MRRDYPRRAVLKAIAGAASMLSPIGAVRAAASQPPADSAQPLWSFDGVTGPEHWSELSPDYALCQFGIEQSPVDLVDTLKVSSAGALEVDYRPVTTKLVEQTWTLQLVFDPGCEITVNSRVFALEHMMIRHPSEHLLSGRALELELQFVHRSERGVLAHLSVFVRQGRQNDTIDMILANLPGTSPDKQAIIPLNPADLLPPGPQEGKSRAFYRYMGSITRPPCTEGVVWTVFKTPIEASPKQIRELATLFPANARPAGTINRRYLLEYGN